jgi:AcrR family transcriptional regulator
MSKAQPRTKPPQERRRELMSAAQRLFLEQGIGDTTIEQITSAAGVAKGTFYLYFASKDEVLNALVESFARELLASIEAAIAQQAPDDWRGRLAMWIRAAANAYVDSMKLHDMLFYESHHFTPEGLVENDIVDHLVTLLQEGAEAKAWRLDDARLTAVFLFNGVHGAVDYARRKEKRLDRERLAKELERLSFLAVGLLSGR